MSSPSADGGITLRLSDANRWVRCPGSAKMPKVDRVESEAALEGTLAHKLAEKMFGNWPGSGLDGYDEWLKWFEPFNETGLIVTDEMFGHAYDFVELVMRESEGAPLLAIEQPIIKGVLDNDRGIIKGVFDVGFYNVLNDAIHVYEFKYGRSTVSPHENYQLAGAAWGVGPDAIGRSLVSTRPRSYTLAVCQPRAFCAGGPVRYAHLSVTDLQVMAEDICLASEHIVRHPSPDKNTGPQCKYCPSRLYCAELQIIAADVLEVLGSNAAPLDPTPEILGAELTYLTRAADIVSQRLSAIKDQVLHMVENGQPVPGWTMERKSGKRTWAPMPEIEFAEQLFGVVLTEKKPITLTKALQCKKDMKPIIEGLLKTPSSKPTLVPFDGNKTKELFKND